VLHRVGLPIWFFVAGIGVAGFLLKDPKSKPKDKLARQIAKILGGISVALLLINGTAYALARFNDSHPVYQPSAIADKPQYYLPGRAIVGTKQSTIKFVDSKLQIEYLDQYGQIITLTETPNTAQTSLACSQVERESTHCDDIAKNIVGQPADEYIGTPGSGHWAHGYQNIRAVVGATLIEIYEPTTLHVMQDDFAEYINSFEQVGKNQIPVN
jgi:hypothetical protein